MQLGEIEPNGYHAMFAFEKYLNTLDLEATHRDLVKIRASQINGCSYCVDMHVKDARKDGENEQRLHMIAVWRETACFTPEERAVLALTEEVTLISGRVSDETYGAAIKLLGEKYTAQVIMAVIGINAWNRIGVSTNMVPALA